MVWDKFDFASGNLPPWLAPLVSLTRPMATTMTAMIVPVGAFVCGTVAAFSPERAMDMAAASTSFLAGIPGELYLLIGGVIGVYSASKTAEAIKAPPPAGGVSPERPPAEVVIETPAQSIPPLPEIDAAPRGRP